MPTLYSWASDADGTEQVRDDSEFNIEVANLTEASAHIIYDLSDNSSMEFMVEALRMWFTTGKISQMPMGSGLYWNVELRD